jgi:hypothetical protein
MSLLKDLKKSYPEETRDLMKKFLESPCCDEDENP